MAEHKENSQLVHQLLTKKVETFRQKNHKLLVELQKKQEQDEGNYQLSRHKKLSHQLASQKGLVHPPRESLEDEGGFQVVKVLTSKLVPLTMEKYR